jgi:hypothetical protein
MFIILILKSEETAHLKRCFLHYYNLSFQGVLANDVVNCEYYTISGWTWRILKKHNLLWVCKGLYWVRMGSRGGKKALAIIKCGVGGHSQFEQLWFYTKLLQTWLKIVSQAVFCFSNSPFLENAFSAQKNASFPSLERFVVKNISVSIPEYAVYSLFSFVSLTLMHVNFSNDSKRLRISLVIRQPCQQKWNIHFQFAWLTTSQLMLYYQKLRCGKHFDLVTLTKQTLSFSCSVSYYAASGCLPH